MMTTPKTYDELFEENELLRWRLEEAETIVDAIRNGIVDAVVVGNPGESVYTLEGADRPYRLLIEAMQQGVAVLTPDGVVLYCNSCFAKLITSSSETLIGRSLDSFVAEADHVRWTEMLREVENRPTRIEVQLHRQNGTRFPASLALSMLPLQKVCLLVTDLSQQKIYDDLVVSKLALRESEIRYRRLFETAKDGILILDTQSGRITDANPYMSELLGYSHEHFIDKELWEIGLFSDRSANETAVRKLQEQGYIRFEHLPLETSSGKRVEVEIVANSYKEDDHSVIQCNIRDITERSQLEAERIRLEKRMQEQAESLEDLHRRKDEFLAMLSHELRNPLSPIVSALQLLGLQKNEDRLQHQARTIIERQVGQLTRLIDDLLEVSRITTGRIHLQQEPVVLNVIVENAIETIRPLIDRHKHNLTVSMLQQPIRLHADAARLEQVVVNLLTNAAKFTHDGGQIEVVVSAEWQGASDETKVADRVNMTASTLATRPSPLTTGSPRNDGATLSGTQGLAGLDGLGRAVLPGDEGLPQRGNVRPDQPDSSSRVVGTSEHRGGTASTAHQRIPEPSEHREGVVDGIGNSLATQSSSGISRSNVAEFAPENVGRNRSNAGRTSSGTGETSGNRQVMSDEKSEAGRGNLSVSDLTTSFPSPLTTRHSPLLPFAVIRVRDTGIGIAPDLLPHVFDLFTQAERSLARSQGGLGIGLALVQRIVELHKGFVEAKSVVGEGSEFVVRLPMITHVEIQRPPPHVVTSHSQETSLKILVVDDNADAAQMLGMLLLALGHEVLTVHDGPSTLDAALDYSPDVILLDIGLPGMDGYEVATRLRQQAFFKDVVLVAMTGYGQDSDRQRSHDSGFNHHLVKPPDFGKLKEILAAVSSNSTKKPLA